MKQKLITQIGIIVSGKSLLNLWQPGQGEIMMERRFLPYDKITKDNILRCVNDAGFGCQSIEKAEIDIYIRYDNGSDEYDRTIYSGRVHQHLFNGYKELRQQGVQC